MLKQTETLQFCDFSVDHAFYDADRMHQKSKSGLSIDMIKLTPHILCVIPSYHHRLVHNLYNPMIHTWTVHVHGNAVRDLQSAEKKAN